MKALTVWQPWATLIAIGAKPYEFRGWKPPRSLIGERIAIHAGARPVRQSEVRALIRALGGDANMTPPCLHPEALPLLERVLSALKASPDTLFGTAEALTLPLSSVVATARLGAPKRGDLCAAEFGYAGNDSDRDGTFNWGWPMLEVEYLNPARPARGAQGLWDWRP